MTPSPSPPCADSIPTNGKIIDYVSCGTDHCIVRDILRFCPVTRSVRKQALSYRSASDLQRISSICPNKGNRESTLPEYIIKQCEPKDVKILLDVRTTPQSPQAVIDWFWSSDFPTWTRFALGELAPQWTWEGLAEQPKDPIHQFFLNDSGPVRDKFLADIAALFDWDDYERGIERLRVLELRFDAMRDERSMNKAELGTADWLDAFGNNVLLLDWMRRLSPLRFVAELTSRDLHYLQYLGPRSVAHDDKSQRNAGRWFDYVWQTVSKCVKVNNAHADFFVSAALQARNIDNYHGFMALALPLQSTAKTVLTSERLLKFAADTSYVCHVDGWFSRYREAQTTTDALPWVFPYLHSLEPSRGLSPATQKKLWGGMIAPIVSFVCHWEGYKSLIPLTVQISGAGSAAWLATLGALCEDDNTVDLPGGKTWTSMQRIDQKFYKIYFDVQDTSVQTSQSLRLRVHNDKEAPTMIIEQPGEAYTAESRGRWPKRRLQKNTFIGGRKLHPTGGLSYALDFAHLIRLSLQHGRKLQWGLEPESGGRRLKSRKTSDGLRRGFNYVVPQMFRPSSS